MPGDGDICSKGSSTKKSSGSTDPIALNRTEANTTRSSVRYWCYMLLYLHTSPECRRCVHASQLHELARRCARGNLDRRKVAVNHLNEGVSLRASMRITSGEAEVSQHCILVRQKVQVKKTHRNDISMPCGAKNLPSTKGRIGFEKRTY